jgi:hypothetical protein
MSRVEFSVSRRVGLVCLSRFGVSRVGFSVSRK